MRPCQEGCRRAFGAFKLLMLLGALCWAPVSRCDVELAFGVYAADKPTVVVKKFRPVVAELERVLDRKLDQKVTMKLQVASSYAKGIEAVVSGEVDIARVGPASYVEIKRKDPLVRVLAVESARGKKQFYGVICVAEDSPIQDVGELKGKSFAFGNANSTIGRYLAQQYLGQHGVLAADLGHYEYLGRHDKVGHAVGAGHFDAGALKEGTFKRLVKQGVPIRQIAQFPNVTKPWIARSGLEEHLFRAIQQSLLSLKDPKALKALKKDGFLPGDDADYRRIRSAIEGNGRFFR